jgi:DNA invertase Pin-like site-specific DNA recombinase
MVRLSFGNFSFKKVEKRSIRSVQIAYSYVRFSHPEQRLGDSLRRQTEAAAAYAAERWMVLDSSLKPDMAVSAFRGRNRKQGNLADFLSKIQFGKVPKGSALLVESLDRLSREEIEESHNLLLSIVRAGVEVHTISDGQVYRRGEMDVQKMIWSIFVLARSGEESKRKSERCASAR